MRRILWWLLMSPPMWALRVAEWVLPALLWSDTMMEDMIAYTEVSFIPVLLLIGVAIPFLISWSRCFLEKSEADKASARADGSEAGSYETGVLGGNGANAILGAFVTIGVPGMICHTFGIVQDMGSMVLLGLGTAILVGWMGDKVIFRLIESKRNGAKAAEARTASASTETKKE